ncbi:TPA: hypothetical protein ACKPX2_000615 [Stenotrophomonas maltophilia]|uniref:hypothetical protein n=1 Tax=Stenotrophomonas maltophilia TaxID=40324 RepID=UPI0013DCF098|nr:hypothetical protein [Stenotrophomonas maltophilia]HEL3245897.1 hypothetical protein [Stenotrophomonas maltophilia]HEL4264309.1 hypothetical protein [Stenotrophomonas maltophilia]
MRTSKARELLASRMGPATQRFDAGCGGGRPELTTQDIAAALAYVPDGLGRELLEALWWPESATRRREHLRKAVIGLVAPEFIRQMHGLATARTEFGIAKACMGWGGGQVTEVQRREMVRAENALDEARAAAWPNNTMEQLGVLAGAVIAEMAKCGCCKSCDGTRVQAAPAGSGVVECEACSGIGLEQLSGRKRAVAIGADKSAYQRFWQPVYEWMLEQMRSAEHVAAEAFTRALNRAA